MRRRTKVVQASQFRKMEKKKKRFVVSRVELEEENNDLHQP